MASIEDDDDRDLAGEFTLQTLESNGEADFRNLPRLTGRKLRQ